MNRTSPSPGIVALAGALLFMTDIAVADPPLTQPWFRTELEAVVDATRRYNPRSIREDREFMGAIIHHDDCYTFTVGAGQPRRDRITVSISVPAGAEIIAFWHTHGARHDSNRYFSHIDTKLVETWQKPFYLADYTGVLKVMVPGAPTLSRQRARRVGLPPRGGYARGKVVSDASGKPIRVAT